jgi:hypothetical protein
MKLNLGSGKNHLPIESGWVNIDKSDRVGADKIMDIFKFPWDFLDNSVEEFNLSHIVEHIPHEIKYAEFPASETSLHSPGGISLIRWVKRWNYLKEYDGFYAFFGEMWRIGKNGAKVHVVSPYGYTHEAFQDPTHTRNLVPQSFAYLTQEMVDGPDFDYNIPCMYKVVSCKFDLPNSMQESEFAKVLTHWWDLTRNMYVELEIIK